MDLDLLSVFIYFRCKVDSVATFSLAKRRLLPIYPKPGNATPKPRTLEFPNPLSTPRPKE
jgi:hypothetical protein